MLAGLGLVVLILVLVQVQVIGLAFRLAGLSPLTAGILLVGSLLGSMVNIPVARIALGNVAVDYRWIHGYGVAYRVPVTVRGRTTLAVNLGGAVIPTAVSAYLAARTGLWVEALVAVSVVAVVAHRLARPVPGVGIVLPALVPGVIAAIAAILLNPADNIGALAYIAGTVGTLVGADLTHLPAIRSMPAPRASIGGAGTFDGIFVSGIVAVLLAAVGAG